MCRPQLRPLILCALGLTLLWLIPIDACNICLPDPKKSVTDWILEADTVVLAREHPKKPLSLLITEVLRGEVASDEPELFLDTWTLNYLKKNPDHRVLAVQTPVAANSPWQRIALAPPELAAVVREMLEHIDSWKVGGKDPEHDAQAEQRRFDFFVRFLESSEDEVRGLAHLEIARAPYSSIQNLGKRLPRKFVQDGFANEELAEWRALYILLSAQSKSPEDQKAIVDAMKFASEFKATANLAAWATAYIELEGSKAVAWLRDHYLVAQGRAEAEIEEVVKALSAHGHDGEPSLRPKITAAYRSLIEEHPRVGAAVIPDLIAWEYWDFTALFKQILESGSARGIWQRGMIQRYLRAAERSKAPPTPTGNGKTKGEQQRESR